MANCINYNCDELGSHTINDECGDEILGGIKHVVLLDCGHSVVDPSDAAEINAALAANEAVLIRNVKLSVDAGSPVEIDPPVACSPAKVITYERQGTFIDGNVNNANVTFYNGVFGGRSLGGMILFECGNEANETITFIDSEIRMQGDRLIPDSNTDFQRFEGTFKWRSKNMPAIYAAPVGVNGL